MGSCGPTIARDIANITSKIEIKSYFIDKSPLKYKSKITWKDWHKTALRIGRQYGSHFAASTSTSLSKPF
jgi:hypothetical protein